MHESAVGGQTPYISDAAATAAASAAAAAGDCSGQSLSFAPMELIGRKAGDLSANCPAPPKRPRRPFGQHPSINLSAADRGGGALRSGPPRPAVAGQPPTDGELEPVPRDHEVEG